MHIFILLFLTSAITPGNAALISQRQFPNSITSTALADVLQQNNGCCVLSSALSICTSLTSGFVSKAATDQAQCLCYYSTTWIPKIFDNAVSSCADYASSAAPPLYPAIANINGFCAAVGQLPAYAIAMTTTTTSASPTSTGKTGNGCLNYSSSMAECAASTPGFASLQTTDQASCLCYTSSTSWAPKVFDGALSTCLGAVPTNSSSNPTMPFSQRFCSNVGNIIGNSSVATSSAPSTTQATGSVSATAKPSFTIAVSTTGSGFSVSVTGTFTTPDLTITIAPAPTGTVSIQKSSAGVRRVGSGEVVLISCLIASTLLFLC